MKECQMSNTRLVGMVWKNTYVKDDLMYIGRSSNEDLNDGKKRKFLYFQVPITS